MADWFKFYENGLHESRFQWAIHEESGVCPVWLWILSECCRSKADHIQWKGADFEMFGISQLTNIPVPRVNQAIQLLIKIEYITIEENHLKILKWNKFQSDYMRKLSKDTPDSVRTVSGQTPESVGLEERRGEESKETIQCTKLPTKEKSQDQFESFWMVYPRKKAKGKARVAFEKALKAVSLEEILSAVGRLVVSPDWIKEGGKYVPYPASWLNSEGWHDQVEISPRLFKSELVTSITPEQREVEFLRRKGL